MNLHKPEEYEDFQERYQVIKQIGSGSFGHVFLVSDTETGETAAAKYQKQEKHKVRTEAAILRSLIQSGFVVQLVGPTPPCLPTPHVLPLYPLPPSTFAFIHFIPIY